MTINEALANLDRKTAVRVVLVNLIPVAGVLFLGWDTLEVLLAYWAETVVVGVAGLARVTTARGEPVSLPGRLRLGGFFLLHYGLFCLIQATLIVALTTQAGETVDVVARTLGDEAFILAAALIAGLQLVELARDWWMSGLWRTSSPRRQMYQPYGRVAVVQIALIFGAGALTMMGLPAGAVIVLCLAKAGLELFTSAQKRKDEAMVDEPLPK